MGAVLTLLLAAAPDVTLDAALELASKQNVDLRVARAQVDVATASIALGHPWELPKLKVQANDLQAMPSGTFTWYAGVSWTPPNPWEWQHAGEAARAKALEASCALASRTWSLDRDVRLAWLDVSGAAAHERLANETVKVRGALLDVLQRRLERGGAATQVDLDLARLYVTDARQDALRFHNAGLKAAQSVAWLVGQPLTPVPLAFGAEVPDLPALETLEARLDHHPAIEVLRARVHAAKEQQGTLAARRLPWPEVQVRLRQKTGAEAQNDLQLALTVPLAVTPAPQLEVQRAVVAREEAQLDAELAQHKAELRILLARAEGLLERWRAFEGDFRQTLEGHEALRARVLRDDAFDPTLLLQADRQAIDLAHKRLDVQLDLIRTVVELEGVAGPALR